MNTSNKRAYEIALALSLLKNNDINLNISSELENTLKDEILFRGDDALFKESVLKAKNYFEYGCGQSTSWVLTHTEANVFSVDTSQSWVLKIKNQNPSSKLHIHWTDVGELLEWGRPASYAKREYYPDYTDWLWQQNINPDIVLVDGRFRVCCFLTTLKYALPGTRILFDDYTDRMRYHIIEEFVERKQTCGTQCLFVVPEKRSLNLPLLDELIERFRYVFD